MCEKAVSENCVAESCGHYKRHYESEGCVGQCNGYESEGVKTFNFPLYKRLRRLIRLNLEGG